MKRQVHFDAFFEVHAWFFFPHHTYLHELYGFHMNGFQSLCTKTNILNCIFHELCETPSYHPTPSANSGSKCKEKLETQSSLENAFS